MILKNVIQGEDIIFFGFHKTKRICSLVFLRALRVLRGDKRILEMAEYLPDAKNCNEPSA
jgi:hypothetical protein